MILDALFGDRPSAALPAPGDDFWYRSLSYDMTGTVTPDSSMQVTAVFACVRVLAESIAQLPLHVMRSDGRRREKATDSPVYRLLYSRPNRRQTSFEWREQMQTHLALRGNAYSLIRWTQVGQVDELIPLHPDRMEVMLLDDDMMPDVPHTSRIGYLYRDERGRRYRILDDEILHLRFMTTDGIIGVSPITWGARAVELSLQAEKHGLSWWKNAAKPGGVIKMPQGEFLDEEAHRRMKQSWRAAHTSDDLYTVAILEGGAEWQPMGISNEDSEWLDSRRFQISEIARIFRLPPHMIFSAIEHGNTYANIEQSDLDYVKHSLLPWIRRWEQSLDRAVIRDDNLYAKFNVDGLLRADMASRASFYQTLWGMGVLSPNEIREKEDLDPVDGGDERFIPSGVSPLGDAGGGRMDAAAAWRMDIAERLANAQIRELEEYRNADPVVAADKLRDFFEVKHHKYVVQAVSPYLASQDSPVDAAAIADHMASSAMQQIADLGLVRTINLWRSERASQIAALLIGDGHG